MVAIVWFREDLRLSDHQALEAAIQSGETILPIFIYDEKNYARTLGAASKWWLHHSLLSLKSSLVNLNSDLIFQYGETITVLKEILKHTKITHMFWHKNYNEFSLNSDKKIEDFLNNNQINYQSFNGSLLFEPNKIKTGSGKHFQVFSAFWKACVNSYTNPRPIPTPKEIKFDASFKKLSCNLESFKLLPKLPWADNFPKYFQIGEKHAQNKLKDFLKNKIDNYKIDRDYPSIDSTSALSPHIRWGEISARQIYYATIYYNIDNHENAANTQFLTELGWREFAHQTFFHNPKIATQPLNSKFNNFPYYEDTKYFNAWKNGLTGYPIVDAGMRELWTTGYMHNRVRMITASFLAKHLLQPWQNGEQWFWDTLLDADIANNPFNWQWVAGCGTDAAPYFRIFNPIIQSEKFDKDGTYIKKWIPELRDIPNKFIHKPWTYTLKNSDYQKPIVEHNQARTIALRNFKEFTNN